MNWLRKLDSETQVTLVFTFAILLFAPMMLMFTPGFSWCGTLGHQVYIWTWRAFIIFNLVYALKTWTRKDSFLGTLLLVLLGPITVATLLIIRRLRKPLKVEEA